LQAPHGRELGEKKRQGRKDLNDRHAPSIPAQAATSTRSSMANHFIPRRGIVNREGSRHLVTRQIIKPIQLMNSTVGQHVQAPHGQDAFLLCGRDKAMPRPFWRRGAGLPSREPTSASSKPAANQHTSLHDITIPSFVLASPHSSRLVKLLQPQVVRVGSRHPTETDPVEPARRCFHSGTPVAPTSLHLLDVMTTPSSPALKATTLLPPRRPFL